MAIQKFPRPVVPKVKSQTDDQLAKVGQVNQLINDINKLNVVGPSPVPYGFDWYPQAGLTTGGVKFQYTDGVELLSYHIRGVVPVGLQDGGFSIYLCTVAFPNSGPFLFPGSISGSIQTDDDNNNFITLPLSPNGEFSIGGGLLNITGFKIYLYSYENNPQGDGSYWYALVADATIDASVNIGGLLAYDYEFLLPNFVTPPTIFQD